MSSTKPVIFISYSHKDEPDNPRNEEIAWLSFVRTYLQPAIKDGIFELFVDEHLPGGADLKSDIERKLRACDVFILLISANSTSSDYIVDTEIAITRDRQAKGEDVRFYPILLTPTPKVALDKFKDKIIRPRDAKPLSAHSYNDRIQAITDIADEIAAIAAEIVGRKPPPPPPLSQPKFVHISGLPETPYVNLVGRDDELKRLDDAWADRRTNVLSLVAEGGAGKSALVNEWLRRMQAERYRAAETALGWSFYSQGTKERATSADGFLNWALQKLGIKLDTTSATAKGDAIAEALTNRRVLLVLDGVEPLQHGPDGQLGQLKDQGLRALLRRFAATAPADAHGLIVLTSRLAVSDIGRWKNSAAPIIDLEKLSDEAGAALLRDNGVWGTDKELKRASHDFGGHPLALGLLASFLKETQMGDVRRRDHIRAFMADADNPRHDHAKRVMESYEREWLANRPELLAIMRIVGLFDRPASADCLNALRAEPAVAGLTDRIIRLGDDEWQRAIAHLREVRLLAPEEASIPDTLDAHPLLREWFGERLRQTNETAWKAAHGRLYEFLRDNTKEGDRPTLEQLMPLYQAIAHGCRAGRHQETLDDVYTGRICKRNASGDVIYYTTKMLGAFGSDLAAVSWFFDTPYQTPVTDLRTSDGPWVLNQAAVRLRAIGRLGEALPAMLAALRIRERAERRNDWQGVTNWQNAALQASNLCELQLLMGDVSAAIQSGKKSITYTDVLDAREDKTSRIVCITTRSTLAVAFHAAGRSEDARRLFKDAEKRQKEFQPNYPLLYSLRGYSYCDLLLDAGDYLFVRKRAAQILKWELPSDSLLDRSLVRLALGRAHLALAAIASKNASNGAADEARNLLYEAVDGLRAAGQSDSLPKGLLADAALRRCMGDWAGVARDLDEVEEIAEPGPMKLFLCDLALEQARLAFAKIEAFAPLHGMIQNSPAKPQPPDGAERKRLHEEAAEQIGIAATRIDECGYHRRDAELAELEAVLMGKKKFSELLTRA